ncbi:MAG: hypothetical protein V7L01_28730 [Nostoc sp.]
MASYVPKIGEVLGIADGEPFWNGFAAGPRCDRSQNRKPKD